MQKVTYAVRSIAMTASLLAMGSSAQAWGFGGSTQTCFVCGAVQAISQTVANVTTTVTAVASGATTPAPTPAPTPAAGLTIPLNFLMGDSVQTMSDESVDAFVAGGVSFKPLGNTTAVDVPGSQVSFLYPITKITLSSQLKVTSGCAIGSALEISRVAKGRGLVKLVVANFCMDYDKKLVLVDMTPMGGETIKQAPLYSFTLATPLGIKYKFPMTVSGHEVLNNLHLTDEAINVMAKALGLSAALKAATASITEHGAITNDIKVQLRSKPVSTTPYTPAP
ncbi:MAG: hypothetical protein Q7U28_16490 [Aquabacterium sp.]|nr:hypothetical protein [Aquabacterium sp.]